MNRPATTKFKRELTLSKDWDNTGRIFLMKGDATYEIKFNFQTEYCTLEYGKFEQTYWYNEHMPALRQHLKSFATFGDPTVLR